MSANLLMRLAVFAIDAGETHTAYLLTVRALSKANKAKLPVNHIMKTLAILRQVHGRRAFFNWSDVA